MRDKFFWAVLGICLVLLLVIITEPFGADNAVLQSMALDWVRFGKIPYIGSWDNNFRELFMSMRFQFFFLGLRIWGSVYSIF